MKSSVAVLLCIVVSASHAIHTPTQLRKPVALLAIETGNTPTGHNRASLYDPDRVYHTRKAPEQGYHGETVHHVNDETQTGDWGKEGGWNEQHERNVADAQAKYAVAQRPEADSVVEDVTAPRRLSPMEAAAAEKKANEKKAAVEYDYGGILWHNLQDTVARWMR